VSLAVTITADLFYRITLGLLASRRIQIDNIELRLGCLSAGDGLQIFRRLNQCASAGDGLALNRLAMARNGGGLQVYCQANTMLHLCTIVVFGFL